MGGIKHGKWNMNPLTPRTPMPNSDDVEALAAWAAADVMVNCKVCGHQILLPPSMNERMDPNNPECIQWNEEVKVGMHKQCFMRYMIAQQVKQNGNQPE